MFRATIEAWAALTNEYGNDIETLIYSYSSLLDAESDKLN